MVAHGMYRCAMPCAACCEAERRTQRAESSWCKTVYSALRATAQGLTARAGLMCVLRCRDAWLPSSYLCSEPSALL